VGNVLKFVRRILPLSLEFLNSAVAWYPFVDDKSLSITQLGIFSERYARRDAH